MLIRRIKGKEGDIQNAFTLVCILFSCAIRFQKNISTSIKLNGKVRGNDLDPMTVELKKWVYIIHEIPIELADHLSKLSREQLTAFQSKLERLK